MIITHNKELNLMIIANFHSKSILKNGHLKA